jgi:diguanylate cyclase (GGDEF)-like protein/PAS domain S-box-containing protein
MDLALTSGLLLLSTAVPVAVGLAWYAWRNRSLPGVVPFLFLIPFCTIWALALAFELVVPTLSEKMIFSDLQFLGIAFLPVTALAVAIDYSGHRALLSKRNVLLACVLPVATVVLTLTNHYHHLMTTDATLLTNGPIQTVGRTWGVWFWIHSAYSYLLLLAALVIIARAAHSTPRVYRRQPLAILVGMCVPAISHALHATVLGREPGWDFTPVALIIAGLTIGWGLMGIRLFSIVPIARHALVENLSDGVLVLDRAERVIDLNGSARRLVGLPAAEILARPLADSWPAWAEKVGPGLETADHVDVHTGENGGRRHYEVQWSPLQRNRTVMGRLVVIRDVTQRVLMEDNLRQQALTDSLTGLPNRTLFMTRLDEAIQQADPQKRRLFAVMVLDLDRFKLINDSIGHLAGDVLLKSVADKLVGCVRDTDTVARMGGDEFMILLHGISNARDLIPILDRIQEELHVPVYFRQQEMTAGSSVGVVIWSPKYNDAEDLLRAADTAMYQAKEAGRGCHRIFDEAMHDEVTRTLRAETDLRVAIRKRNFSMSYQPIVDLKTGTVRAIEALLRWQHPVRGTVYPQEFISIAENGGLMVELGDIALSEVCRQISWWQHSSSSAAHVRVCLNISPRQLVEPDFAGAVLRRLAEWRISADCLTFEITEKALTHDPRAVAEVLRELRAMGIRLALDDFGSGTSSLQHLTNFEVEELKIDRTFVSRFSPQSTELEIVRSLIALAHTLGLQVTGEGVERSEQWRLLSELGCDAAQGYFVGRPMGPDELAEYLKDIEDGGYDFAGMTDAAGTVTVNRPGKAVPPAGASLRPSTLPAAE